MDTDIRYDEARRKAFRYDTQDGLLEFLAGVMFFFIARAVQEPHLAWAPALLVFPMRWALRFFKERYTWPRVGYVKLRNEETGAEMGRGMLLYLAAVVFVLGVALSSFGDVTSWDHWMRWMPALVGGFCSGAFLYLANRSGYPRYFGLFAVCLAWGIACSLMDTPTVYAGIARWAVGFGLVCILTGVAVFVMFVRNHPVRSEEAADA